MQENSFRTERHPFEPFLPCNAKVLMLGSFPPQEKRWSIKFYYPNFINDMWRIFGVVFFGDRNHFVDVRAKKFKLDEIVRFCNGKGIAMYDTATEVKRLKDNASDKFLEVVTPTDIPAMLRRIPECRAIVTTGQKATDVLCETFSIEPPETLKGSAMTEGEDSADDDHDQSQKVNGTLAEYSEFLLDGRHVRLYRLPSSSRAYPLPLEHKAAAYRRLFTELELLNVETAHLQEIPAN